ncbi:MAG: hypothetical protein K8H90_08330, partial [Thermoanaerobaculia bacterium]|nr:hypothetical protein [Thermoanaerobaculia bacterium]
MTAQDLCGAALAACDLQTDMACLERTYACGEYDTLIETLFVEDFAPTADQKFYIGAAFFGKHVRERSAGIQCEMVKFSREYLTDYLSVLDVQFTETGSFGTVRQMDQLYHATQMLSDLGDVAGCPESALTRARIAAVARSAAVSFAKDVFLHPPSATREAFDTLVLSLRSFVSRASDLETGIALRRVEIRSAETHLGAIRDVFAEVFGPVTGTGAALAVDTSVLESLQTRTAGMLRNVEVEEAAFAAALGGISAEQYAAIRGETVARAEEFLKLSAFHINMIGVLLPTDPARTFWLLASEIGAETAGRAAHADLRQIREDWAAHG